MCLQSVFKIENIISLRKDYNHYVFATLTRDALPQRPEELSLSNALRDMQQQLVHALQVVGALVQARQHSGEEAIQPWTK